MANGIIVVANADNTLTLLIIRYLTYTAINAQVKSLFRPVLT